MVAAVATLEPLMAAKPAQATKALLKKYDPPPTQ
jgi:hypothetical protein